MSQSDSAIVTASLTLQGVWLHDPTDPSGTAAQYLFGGSGRTESPDLGATELQFVGRELPTYEFGEARHEPVQTTIQVPHGPNWATQVDALVAAALSKRVWCYRDNRRRKRIGPIQVRVTDQEYGSSVDLTVQASDFDEAV